jgi:Tol biopolymer transport system component
MMEAVSGGGIDIYRMSLEGGNRQLVVDLADDAFGPVWSPDGTEIAFSSRLPGTRTAIFVVSANGGDPRLVVELPSNDIYPVWSPDGLSMAFTHVYDDQGRSGSPLDNAGGTWVVSRERVGDAWGDPVRLPDFPCVTHGWAPDSESLVCRERSELVIVSRSGDIVSRIDPQMAFSEPHFSHDGSEIYFIGGRKGIWSMPVTGGGPTRLVAFDNPSLVSPVFAFPSLTVGPDHFYVTFSEYESDIYVMDLEY